MAESVLRLLFFGSGVRHIGHTSKDRDIAARRQLRQNEWPQGSVLGSNIISKQTAQCKSVSWKDSLSSSIIDPGSFSFIYYFLATLKLKLPELLRKITRLTRSVTNLNHQ